MRSPSRTRRPVALITLLVALLGVTGCTTAISGSPKSSGQVIRSGGTDGVDPSFVTNTDGSAIDRLAATVVTDVRAYWTELFPLVFDTEWTELRGGYFSVDTAHDEDEQPPCVGKPSDVEGNAFYCPSADVIAWDRAALLPVLQERFGEAAVMLVLAHELGHAVQRRTGITIEVERSDPARYPTVLIEAMADCYAGSFVRWVADGKAEHLTIARDRLDQALEALITFRDPVGTEQTSRGAHGDAFDRVSAFLDGFDQGAEMCSKMRVDNRTFTQRGFTSAADQERGGNLPFDQLITSIKGDLATYFGKVVTERGKQWTAPEVREVDGAPECGGEQGPAALCSDRAAIEVGTEGELPRLHTELGDYATGMVLASRFGLAAMAAVGAPLDGEKAQRGVLCLTGAYTGSLLGRTEGFGLSPGDLDEAMQVLLRYDYPGRDTGGKALTSGYDRVSAFRVGALDGAESCGLG